MRLVVIMTLGIIGICHALPIFVVQQPAPLTPYAHPSVLANSAMEDTLPDELKNHFYKDPKIAAGLAKESWLTPKETQVIDREADRIPRQKIFDVLHSAGLT